MTKHRTISLLKEDKVGELVKIKVFELDNDGISIKTKNTFSQCI